VTDADDAAMTDRGPNVPLMNRLVAGAMLLVTILFGLVGGVLLAAAGVQAIIGAPALVFDAGPGYRMISGWAFTARLVPMVVALAGISFVIVQIFLMVFTPLRSEQEVAQASSQSRDVHMDVSTEFTGMPRSLVAVRAVRYFTWLLVFLAASHVFGLLIGLAVFLIAYMRLEARESWFTSIGVAAACWVFSYVLFDRWLMVPWPQTFLGEWFPNVPLLRRLGAV
jgi:hypothetical protein